MADKANPEENIVTNKKLKGTTFFQKLFTEHPLGVIGALICLVLLLTGIFADYLAPYGMNEVYVLDNLQKPNEKYDQEKNKIIGRYAKITVKKSPNEKTNCILNSF